MNAMNAMNATYRPIGNDWPNASRVPERTRFPKRSPFRAGWEKTLDLLHAELDHLNAKQVVFQIDVAEDEIRLDGYPRANARPRSHGIIISFESKHGPLRYLTDVFDDWQANVRAIALGLEALRKVDRYGITRRGEQYTGWKQIEAVQAEADEERDAQRLIDSYGGPRLALKATHPDRGGDPEEFARVQEARKVLGI